MRLDHATFIGRFLSRFGRLGIALMAVTAFLVVGGGVYLTTVLIADVWFPKLTLIAAFAAGGGVYRLFEHFDLIPESPDKLITLSLTERSNDDASSRKPWISGDGGA